MNKRKVLLSLTPILGGTALSAGLAIGLLNSSNGLTTEQASSNQSTSNNSASFKITSQSGDTTTQYGSITTLSAVIQKKQTSDYLRLEWEANKGDGKGFVKVQSGFTSTSDLINSSVLSITFPSNISSATTYIYKLVITNVNKPTEKLESKEINVTFLPQTSIYIDVTKQPESKTVKSGESVSLTTEAKIHSGSNGTLGYQWFVDKDNKGNFSKINGATSSTYTFTAENTTSSNIAPRYMCKFYVDNSSTYLYATNVATITIAPKDGTTDDTVIPTPPSVQITNLTKDVIAKIGSQTTLTVTAEASDSSTLTYKWFELKDNSWIEISGQTNSTYVINSVDEGTSQYMVQVSVGRETLQSDNIKVIGVTNKSDAIVSVNSFTNQNTAVLSSTGNLLTTISDPWFGINVKDACTGLTYQWYYTDNKGTKIAIKDATGTTLTPSIDLINTSLNNGGWIKLSCNVYENGELATIVNDYNLYLSAYKLSTN